MLKAIVIVAWVLLALDALVAFSALAARNMGGDAAGRGLGTSYGLLLLLFVAGGGAILLFGARRQSIAGVSFSILVLGAPAWLFFRSSISTKISALVYQFDVSRIGRYHDPAQRELAHAIQQRDTTAMRAILARKPNLKGRDPSGYDLLSYAMVQVRDEHVDMDSVVLLLDAGMDPNESRLPNGQSLLPTLAYDLDSPEHRRLFQLLIEHGADVNARNANTGDPVILTAYNDPDALRFLVEHGASVDAGSPSGMTPLIDATWNGHYEAAVYLVRHGANLEARSRDGTTVDSALAFRVENARSSGEELPEGWRQLRDAIAKRRGGS